MRVDLTVGMGFRNNFWHNIGVLYLIGVADESKFVLEVGLCTRVCIVVQFISHTRMQNLKICRSTLKSEAESSNLK